MEYQNNYPVVICHGLMGWGEQDLIDKKYPHFGLTHEKDLCKHLREQGIEVHRPSLGPVNSGWDRACVLWAYLFGGRVDYGKVHSEKYGHARFGREYPGVMKDLGQDGPHKKINLFGHSFGGPTVKEICALFVYGSEEERNGTDPEDLSPLFAGGHGGLVHTVTTLSGVNNGTTLASLLGNPGMTFMTYYMLVINSVFATTPVMKYYNFMTQQWGLMPEVEDIHGWKLQTPWSHLDAIKAYNKNKTLDAVTHEMKVEVVQELVNPHQLPLPDIYYFAQRADGTVDDGKGGRKPSYDDMCGLCWSAGWLTAKFHPKKLAKYGVFDDPNWKRCDGF
ncbi:MAG: hypothetical protein GX658_03100, partial [Clostridiales bacterium]|nr:hypothetical protein [Clostridiales bacterium]